MLTLENYLSEATSKMERGIGDWTSILNASLSHIARFSPYTETIDSKVQANSMRITAVADGDVEVATERFDIDVGIYYKALGWISGENLPVTDCGLRFYDVGGTLLGTTNTEFTYSGDDTWNRIWHFGLAPQNSAEAEMYVTFNSMLTDEQVFISRPSVMQQAKITSSFVDHALYFLPDYLLEADLDQTTPSSIASTPMIRYVSLGTKQLGDTMDDVVAWDYVPATFSASGENDFSSLTDPDQADADWLEWLAQLMGVSLDTLPRGGRSPWNAFEFENIDTWTDWEESIDPASIPGVVDTEWFDLETFSPDYFDMDTARRLQITSGFNGVLSGTAESIITYITTLLNTGDEDPFVYIVKHYATNPWRILVSTIETEDPDPFGEMLRLSVESSAPAGTNVVTAHGVSVTARTFYNIPLMFYNMWDDIDLGGGALSVRFVENSAANGQHIVLANVTGATEPYWGGGVALARWYPGFAFYSGAMEVTTDNLGAYNIVGDIDIRVLVSNIVVPAVGPLELASSPNKWALSVDSTGSLQFDWENAGSNSITSTTPVNWGSPADGPFWVRVTLDVNNDASGHDVAFYTAPTLYEDAWTQIGTTVTTAGTSGIDSVTATLAMLGKDTNPEDGASGIVYRMMMHNGIGGATAADIDLTGEIEFADTLVNTGTTFFKLPITNIRVDVTQAAAGATNLNESIWTAQVHQGHDDYFYLGTSPYKYDTGNPTGLGDTLTASGLPSDTYDWTIVVVGGTTITGSTGTVTSITWDSDVYGGESILNIFVRESTGQTVKGFFSAALLPGLTATAADVYGVDWTISRAWTTTAFYEYSAFVDQDHVTTTLGDGVFDSGIVFDPDEPSTVVATLRRLWSGSGITDIVDHTTGAGWKLRYNGDLIEAIVTDGSTDVTLSYDEVAGGTLGDFTLITLRRDVVAKTITLWAGGAVVDTAADPFVSNAFPGTTGSTGIVGDDAAVNKFDIRYFGVFDRKLADADMPLLVGEMERLASVLPQGTKTIIPLEMTPGSIVHTPGVDWYSFIVPSIIDSTPTIHEPTMSIFTVPAYIPTAYAVHSPQINMSMTPALAQSLATTYSTTVANV